MSKTNMSDVIDECLGVKKIKQKNEIKKPIIDLKNILEQDEDDITLPDEESPEKETLNQETEQEPIVDKKELIKSARQAAKDHEIKGDKILELAVKIDDHSLGNIEIGGEEYGTLTDVNSLLDLYSLSSNEFINPKSKIKSLSITVQEEVSQTDKGNISLMMKMNKDETVSINVLVNEIGQTFDKIETAIQYFDNQYKTNILDVINKKVRD